MPDVNGDEVLKVIKGDPDKRDIPVIMSPVHILEQAPPLSS
jgi:hypothetical protein